MVSYRNSFQNRCEGKSFYEVPINYYGRTYEEGKNKSHNGISVWLTIFLKILP